MGSIASCSCSRKLERKKKSDKSLGTGNSLSWNGPSEWWTPDYHCASLSCLKERAIMLPQLCAICKDKDIEASKVLMYLMVGAAGMLLGSHSDRMKLKSSKLYGEKWRGWTSPFLHILLVHSGTLRGQPPGEARAACGPASPTWSPPESTAVSSHSF